MYQLHVTNIKTENNIEKYVKLRQDIKEKLERLKENPRKANGAHQLHGKLKGKWACWLGSNIRTIYLIDESIKEILILAIGTHKIY